MSRKTRGPFNVSPFFTYATGVRPVSQAASPKPPKDKPADPVTTMMVGEEGTQPPPGKPTTPAMGEEGVGDVPTTTIAKGEEGAR